MDSNNSKPRDENESDHPNPIFFVVFGSERMRIMRGCRIFWMLARIWSEIGSDADLNSQVICAYVENYILIKN